MHSVRQAYCEFLNTPHGTEVYRRFKRILYGEHDSLVAALDHAVLRRVPALRRERVRLCDIGGGDGDRITRIVSCLRDAFGNDYELDFVEQSRIYADGFGRRAKPSYLAACVHHGLFEELSLPPSLYDTVFLVHSIFAFANGAAVEKVLGLVRPGGNAVVVSNAGESFLGGLKRLVDADFGDARYEITNLSTALDVRGVRFATQTFDTTWEIQLGRWSEDTAVILDWISLGRYASFADQKRRELETYLCDMSQPTPTGRRFTEQEIVLVVPPI